MRYSKKITVPTVVSATARLSSLTRIQPSREQYISTTMFLPPCFYRHVSTAMFLPPCFYRHVDLDIDPAADVGEIIEHD
ncbi:MAG: hypothetical protein QGH99_05115 [Pseudomonadales bacterium]|nr:hypothetical protein [Pseudomonadales bacterium]